MPAFPAPAMHHAPPHPQRHSRAGGNPVPKPPNAEGFENSALDSRLRGNDDRDMIAFQDKLAGNAAQIERALDTLLGVQPLTGPGEPPARLIDSMRHGTLEGGKRLRPFMLRETALMLGVAAEMSLPA